MHVDTWCFALIFPSALIFSVVHQVFRAGTFVLLMAERWSGVLSSVVRSVYSFLLQFHYLTVGSGL